MHVPPLAIDAESPKKGLIYHFSPCFHVSESIVAGPTILAVVGPIVDVRSYSSGALQRHLPAPMAILDFLRRWAYLLR